MGKVIDITDKLNFEEKPAITIKGRRIEVNDDAANVIKLMSMVDNENPSPSVLGKMAEMLFTEEGYNTLTSLGLNMIDFSTVVETAMILITGEDEEGELVNDTMTSSATGIS